jgi:hypothetical protein
LVDHRIVREHREQASPNIEAAVAEIERVNALPQAGEGEPF